MVCAVKTSLGHLLLKVRKHSNNAGDTVKGPEAMSQETHQQKQRLLPLFVELALPQGWVEPATWYQVMTGMKQNPFDNLRMKSPR